jgi:HK97 gp10 family phage protein
MSDVHVDVSAVRDLADDLARHTALVPKITSKHLSEIAATLRDDARAAAPSDTGALRSSIRLRGGDGYRVVYTSLRYARFVEYGTSTMGPRPFLWPAGNAAEEALTAALGEVDPFD